MKTGGVNDDAMRVGAHGHLPALVQFGNKPRPSARKPDLRGEMRKVRNSARLGIEVANAAIVYGEAIHHHVQAGKCCSVPTAGRKLNQRNYNVNFRRFIEFSGGGSQRNMPVVRLDLRRKPSTNGTNYFMYRTAVIFSMSLEWEGRGCEFDSCFGMWNAEEHLQSKAKNLFLVASCS